MSHTFDLDWKLFWISRVDPLSFRGVLSGLVSVFEDSLTFRLSDWKGVTDHYAPDIPSKGSVKVTKASSRLNTSGEYDFTVEVRDSDGAFSCRIYFPSQAVSCSCWRIYNLVEGYACRHLIHSFRFLLMRAKHNYKELEEMAFMQSLENS